MSNKDYIVTEEELFYLCLLVKTADVFTFSGIYYFGDYAECCICINKKDDCWYVYGCERGNKFDIKTFDNCKEACIAVIEECAYTKEELEIATEYFKSNNMINITEEEKEMIKKKWGIKANKEIKMNKRVKRR